MKITVGFVLVFMLLATGTYAQSLYNQGALISIRSNTTIVVPDSIVNNGDITNNGKIIIRGAWINNSMYNTGMGSLVLASSTPQKINHNDQSLTQLTISGGGDKVFEQDIIVANQLMMEDGLLISSNGARIIVNEGASITGASDASYIVGEVIHKGTGIKSFPVGTTDAFLPFELIEVAGDSPELGVIAYEGNVNPETVGTLEEVSTRWSWELSVKSGEFSGSPVRLTVNQENLDGAFEQYVVAETINDSNPFHSLGQSSLSGDRFDGFVTSTLNAIAGFYAVGLDLSITEEKPELIIFNAVTPNGDNRHEFLKIENIDFYPDNNVIVYNKLGNKVFEVDGYNNRDIIFSGFSDNKGSELLPNGTYYYYIDKKDGSVPVSGYFVLNK